MEGGLYRTKQGGLDYSHDFFGKAAFLTVSGQLQAEYFATALSNVYTFAPTFRAEGHAPLSHAVHPAEYVLTTDVNNSLVVYFLSRSKLASHGVLDTACVLWLLTNGTQKPNCLLLCMKTNIQFNKVSGWMHILLLRSLLPFVCFH